MCGIGAIYGKKIANKEFAIRRSLELVKHRGFSHYEIKILDNCVLGGNRLQIVDRSRAIQPQSNEDESVFVVFNGEIFNYKKLKKELLNKRHIFRTDSDTEVLVHLWEEYKERMLGRLDSEMFAFFIYDKKRDVFFAARDPYGVKPLYYARDKLGNWHFASEIKQLTQFKEIDEIEFFPQGHYMLNGKLSKYHRVPYPSKKSNENLNEIIANIRRLFDEAVKKRVDTDLPIAVFFSGGLDSASVLSTAMKYHDNVTAIIVGHASAPDVLVAKRYCKENNIKFTYFDPPNEKELSELIPKIVYITESFEPNMIRQSAVSYYISKVARENGFKVVLCGEGPDEIFAGYPEFKNCKNSSDVSKMITTFIENLPRTQFQRVDRTSMHFTVEVRVPFFDTNFVDYALKIPSELKIKKIGNEKTTKWILREAMRDRLPDYIVNRPKVVLSEGAGYKGNQLVGGLFYEIVKDKITDVEFERIKREYPDWNITNKEVAFYFEFFNDNLFTKAKFNKKRPLVNAIDSIKDERADRIAENILNSIDNKEIMKKTPFREDEIKKSLFESIRKKQPIRFVGYWGVEKKKPDKAEIIAFESLKHIENNVKKYYLKSEIILILTDLHGKINEVNEKIITDYYTEIRKLAQKYGFKTIFLSKIYGCNKLTIEYVKHELNEKSPTWWRNIKLKKELVKSADKHHGGKNKEEGAKLYALASSYDSRFVEKIFSDSIFFTYNSPKWQEILPNLPTIYLYGVGKNKSIKPWHISING